MKNKPIKVLLWSPAGAGLHYNGAGSNAYKMFAAAPPGLFEVHLVHGSDKHISSGFFKTETKLHSIDNYTGKALAIFLREAKSFLKDNIKNYDVFHGINAFETTVRPAGFAQRLGLPSIIRPANHYGGLAPGGRLSRILRLHKKRQKIARGLSSVVAISSEIKSEMESYGINKDNICFIPNGVDTTHFFSASHKYKISLRGNLGLNESDFVICFVGELGERKSPHVIIDVLSRLPTHCKLLLAGPTKDREYVDALKELVRDKNLDGRVIFTGFLEDPRVVYHASDAFALPSINEGMPNSLLEAMSCGLASFATPVSGVGDIINHRENGYVINGLEEFVQNISELANDPSVLSAVSARAKKTIIDGFSTTFVIEKYVSLFNKIIE